jgi:hypothetical protein
MSFYCKENLGNKLDVAIIDGELVVTIEAPRIGVELVAVLDEDQSQDFIDKTKELEERI